MIADSRSATVSYDEEAGELAGAPIDLLLTEAALGRWRRYAPSTSTLRFVAYLAGHPSVVAGPGRVLAVEMARILIGTSTVTPGPKDKRFSDPAWSTNPALRRVVQTYLTAADAANRVVDNAVLPAVDRERVAAAISNLVDASAPSNNPVLNPQVVKATVDTGGANLWRGLGHFVHDMAEPPRVPTMVESTAFEVGKTVAATPGAVVLQTPIFELLQYVVTTERVRAVPLVIIPPTINKYYVIDMAPERSLVEYLVRHGHQVFVISWRNPDARHADWGFDTYGQAILDALDATRRITSSPNTALLSLCSGGILTSMVLAHLAAIGELDVIAANAMSVTVLDQANAGLTGALLTPSVAQAAVRASKAKGYIDGRSLAEVFAWLRPNDLIWNYWVSSYLLGGTPKPFDVLFWNADTTRMTAALHRDFIDLAQRNALTKPGQVAMLGTPVDLSKVNVDSYITAGIADHLCAWQNCYRTTQLLGGKSRFVLSTSGHIASIVNPPGNPKANFRTAENNQAAPEDWLADAATVAGSWWPDFSSWLHTRTGEEVRAPSHPGSIDFPPLEPAPGTYVYQK